MNTQFNSNVIWLQLEYKISKYFRYFVDLVVVFLFFGYNPTYYIIIAVSVPAFLGDVETSSFLVVIALYLINFRLLCSPFLELLL